MKTERFYFAAVSGHGRLLLGTIRGKAEYAREAALAYLPSSSLPQTWAACRKLGFRVVKVAITEYRPRASGPTWPACSTLPPIQDTLP